MTTLSEEWEYKIYLQTGGHIFYAVFMKNHQFNFLV